MGVNKPPKLGLVTSHPCRDVDRYSTCSALPIPSEASLRRQGRWSEFWYGHHKQAEVQSLTLEQDLADAHFRLCQTTIESLSWEKIIEKYDRPHTLFYCDPPYWQTEGYGVEFGFEHYERMAELAKTIQGTMVISHIDHPDIRKVFEGLPVVEVDYNYTVGGANKRSECVELIIGNWKGGIPKKRECQGGLF